MKAPDFPPELWLRILHELPQPSLQSAHLSSRLLHSLSRPILFSEFTFSYPKFDKRPLPWESLDLPTAQHKLDRLIFWASDSIAPYVLRCTASFRDVAVTVGDQDPLVSTFVSNLARLKNLRELCFGNMLYIDEAVIPRDLKHLTRIQIGGILRDRRDSPPVLTAKSFSFSAIPQLQDIGDPLYFLSILDPSTVETLSLRPDFAHRIFSAFDPTALQPFANLHTLDIILERADYTQLHTWLSPFPALRHLTLHIRLTCRPDVPLASLSPMAPHLRTFVGSIGAIPLVLQSPTVTELTIRDGSLREILSTLQGADTRACANVSSLAFSVRGRDLYSSAENAESAAVAAQLSSVFARFHSLNHLSICIHLASPQMAQHDSTRLGELLKRMPHLLARTAATLETVELRIFREGAPLSFELDQLKISLWNTLLVLRFLLCDIF